MTESNWRSIHAPCEICNNAPASEIQGGVDPATHRRKLWFCCKECKSKIIDERRSKRRIDEQ